MAGYFRWAQNNLGQTGLGTTTGSTWIATPIDSTNLGGRKITQVAAGEFFTLLLAEDGSVFSFGSSASGELGLGTPGSRSVATPIDATNLGGRKVTQISADYQQSLLPQALHGIRKVNRVDMMVNCRRSTGHRSFNLTACPSIWVWTGANELLVDSCRLFIAGEVLVGECAMFLVTISRMLSFSEQFLCRVWRLSASRRTICLHDRYEVISVVIPPLMQRALK
jgi:regulator of chromosome condensation (RCC1) repeat-containing protein